MIKIIVDGQSLRWYDRAPKVAADSVEFVKFKFLLSEEWDDHVVVAQFSQKGATYNKVLEDSCCTLPVEIEDGKCFISIFGQIPGGPQRATVIPLLIDVSLSGFVGNASTPIPPTPDLYSQLVDYFSKHSSGGAGAVDPEDIAQAVEDYLTANMGVSSLVVTYDSSTQLASHSSSEIKDVIASGGIAVFAINRRQIPVMNTTDASVTFGYLSKNDKGLSIVNYVIGNDKTVRQYLSDSKFGKVNTVNGVEPDENGNIEIEIPEGFSGSWSDLKDRPFGEGGVIYFEGQSLEIQNGEFRLPNMPLLESGKTYTFIIDGVTYYAELIDDHEMGDNSAYIDGVGRFSQYFNIGSDNTYDGNSVFVPDDLDVTSVSISISDGSFKYIDEKFIPDTIARVKDIPKDFVTSWNDLTDKPFGDATEVILEETTLTFSVDNSYEYVFPYTKLFVNGETYIVVVDGVPYEVTADVDPDMLDSSLRTIEVGCPVYVTQSLIADDNNNITGVEETYVSRGGTWEWYESLTQTVAIYKKGGVKTLDEKYIPDNIARIEDVKKLGYVHAIPTSLSMVNAIKRARQLTDIEWTAKGTFDGKKKVDGEYLDHDFVEGQTYKGVPYAGGVASRYTYVGLNVDLDTFFSAVQNPRSILYTFNENGANNHTKGGAYYGTVCSKFAQGVLNIPASMNTSNVDNIEGLDTIAEIGKYNEYDVKLCDIMVDPSYHTVIVTDILYDSFGRVAFIEISEAVTPLCRRLLWTPEEFNTQWVPTYKLCRYQHINDIPYTKKEYVNIESENAEIPASITDPTLMPQYGDKKNNKFKSGGTMPVHILKSGYTKAVVLRDGVVISETDITNATEFTYPLDTVGYIEMYLEDANGNQSEHRYACVTKATIEVTDSAGYNDGQLAVKYTGSSGKPHYVQFNGMSEFCRLDGLGRSTIVDENNALLSFDVDRAARSVRVAYQNEYGTYYSDYADVVINVDTDGDPYIARGTLHEGYTLTEDSSELVANDQSANSWVYTGVPVEANTTYLVEGATRIWFFAYSSSGAVPISSIVADEQETPYQFTTPDKAWYMSVCYTEDTASKGSETVVRIGATDALTDILVSETGAELVDGYKLNAGSYRTESDANQFTFKNIPVEQGATYYTRGANRVWLLDANMESTGRTGNALSTWKEAGVITVAEKADSPEVKYISITYSKNAGAAPDMVYIRKLS